MNKDVIYKDVIYIVCGNNVGECLSIQLSRLMVRK